MPKYQTTAQRKKRYDTISRAEGDMCIVCWIERRVKRSPPRYKLEIDHADGDHTNWSWENLHLVCHSCNCRLREIQVKTRVTMLREYSDQVKRERERSNLTTWDTVIREQLHYESGSPEMKANQVFIKRWLTRVHEILSEEGSEKKKDLITRAAHFANCSKQTSTNYLEVYSSIDGPFMETTDDNGNLVIKYRVQEPIIIERKISAPSGDKTPSLFQTLPGFENG